MLACHRFLRPAHAWRAQRHVLSASLKPSMNNVRALIQSKKFRFAVLQAAAGAIVIFQTSLSGRWLAAVVKSVLDTILRIGTDAPIGGVLSAFGQVGR